MLASLNLPRIMPCDVATRWNSTHVQVVKTTAVRQQHTSSSAEQIFEVPNAFFLLLDVLMRVDAF